MPAGVVEVRVPARVHLAGNPSDAYGGAVLSTTVPQLIAAVRLRSAPRVSISGPSTTWASAAELTAHTAAVGHHGGDAVVTAAIAEVHAWFRRRRAELDDRPFDLHWSTAIPRSVGLAGSSAIAIATIEAIAQWWGTDLPADVVALLALAAERDELGIGAGIADRFVQAHRGVVLSDARGDPPRARPVSVPVDVPLLVAWSQAAASPSQRYHAELRSRLAHGEGQQIITRLAELAVAAAEALAAGDLERLRIATDESFDGRAALGPLDPKAIEPVAPLRAAGAAVNFAGSGGAVVALGDPDTLDAARRALPPGWQAITSTIASGSPA